MKKEAFVITSQNVTGEAFLSDINKKRSPPLKQNKAKRKSRTQSSLKVLVVSQIKEKTGRLWTCFCVVVITLLGSSPTPRDIQQTYK